MLVLLLKRNYINFKNNMTKNVKAKVSDTMKSRRQIAALITLLMLITVSSVFAQGTKKLTGIVSDLSGEPLIGVSIVVKGTTIGTVTDLNGGVLIKHTR